MKKITQLLLVVSAFLQMVSSVGAATVEYDLDVAWQKITIKDKIAEGMTINGHIPGPTLHFTEGDIARIKVHNSIEYRNDGLGG